MNEEELRILAINWINSMALIQRNRANKGRDLCSGMSHIDCRGVSCRSCIFNSQFVERHSERIIDIISGDGSSSKTADR